MVVASLALIAGAGPAAGSGSDTITLDLQAHFGAQPALDVLIPNFERVYPNIKVDATYSPNFPELYQIETTELGAGNAPALLYTQPGCGTPIAICVLAKAGDLAPMVNKPWVKWSIPLVTSLNKYDHALYGFTPTIAPYGIFTDDDLFKKLGVKVPQTFSQLLDLCQKAKADGQVAVYLDGGSQTNVSSLLRAFANATVYAKDKQFVTEQKAAKVTFDGTAGWHQALQMFIDMSNAGCFQTGNVGEMTLPAIAEFDQGQGLIYPQTALVEGNVLAAQPSFTFHFYPLPIATGSSPAPTTMSPGTAYSVNAHASPQDQAAAQTFIDFLARPKQAALYGQLTGGLSQYEFLHDQTPAYMSSAFASVLKEHDYLLSPSGAWWNADVLLALQQYGIGLITGQSSIDDVLNAMDVAWKEGPA